MAQRLYKRIRRFFNKRKKHWERRGRITLKGRNVRDFNSLVVGSIVKGFRTSTAHLKTLSVKDSLPRPHNGLRPPKLRRL
jgi:ribosomal protein S11